MNPNFLNRLKTWLKRAVISCLLVFCLIIVWSGGYLLGWKSGPAPNRPSTSVPTGSDRRVIQAAAPNSNAQTATVRLDIGSLSAAEISEIGLTNVLNEAWRSVRFGADHELAFAKLHGLLEKLDPASFPTAFTLACDLQGGRTRRDAIHLVLRQWARVDPTAALASCAKQFHGEDRFQFLTPLIGQVARENPPAAFNAYREHLAHMDSPSHDSAVFPLTYIFPEWAQRDFDAAWAEVQRRNPREKEYAIRGMARLLQQEGETGDRLLRVLNESGDAALLDAARKEVVRNLAGRGAVDTAVQWLDSQDLPAETRQSLEENMARTWADQNPRAAAEWLLSQSEPADRGKRLQGVIQTWADWEPTACGEWLNEHLAQGRQIDAAIQTFARAISSKDAAAALTWTAAISDSTMRRETAASLGKLFEGRKISQATDLVEASNLSPNDKRAVLEQLSR